jgi:hypothetical protein
VHLVYFVCFLMTKAIETITRTMTTIAATAIASVLSGNWTIVELDDVAAFEVEDVAEGEAEGLGIGEGDSIGESDGEGACVACIVAVVDGVTERTANVMEFEFAVAPSESVTLQ